MILQVSFFLFVLLKDEVLPLARKGQASMDADSKAKALAALEKCNDQLQNVSAGMDLNAEQAANVKSAAKVNSFCIKLGAMAQSKNQNKQDIVSAAKNLTDLLGEMNALLGLASAKGGEGASGALADQMSISSALVVEKQPQPKPRPGAAKKIMKKVAGPATSYNNPQKNVAQAGLRDSVGSGFLAVGAGGEELKVLSLKGSKGANLIPDTDPIVTGVRSLGEQLAVLSTAATKGDNKSLLDSGKAIHEQMKNYSAELMKRAKACKDPKIAHEMITLANQVRKEREKV